MPATDDSDSDLVVAASAVECCDDGNGWLELISRRGLRSLSFSKCSLLFDSRALF